MRLTTSLVVALVILSGAAFAGSPQIQGSYLETRSCDIYTGACVANSEMGLSGEEATMAWSIAEGGWKGVALDGLSVVVVVRGSGTLGSEYYDALPAKAVVIVDKQATADQEAALVAFAREMTGELTEDIVDVQRAPIAMSVNACANEGCASLTVGEIIEISTRCLGGEDHLCGNEETFYAPLTEVTDAKPAYTNFSTYTGKELGRTWDVAESRSAFIAKFAR